MMNKQMLSSSTLSQSSTSTVDMLDVFKSTNIADIDAVKIALRNGFQAHRSLDSAGRSILHTAAAGGSKEHLDIVKFLLSMFKSSLLNLQDSAGATPLHIAAERRRLDTVIELIKAGASVNVLNKSGLTPLDMDPAIQNVVLEAVQHRPEWVKDEHALRCQLCGNSWSTLNRRHHCRHCGRVIDSRCCHQEHLAIYKFNIAKPARLCLKCHPIVNMSNRKLHKLTNAKSVAVDVNDSS